MLSKNMDSIITQRASSSSSFAPSFTYDVFLSFRGKDTRNNFTDHLYNNLIQKGIRTFIDDELRRGEEISQALMKAIEGSRISIIVFSENYASSRWCLEELVKILECKESKQQLVLPIFYKVNPTDVRHQYGSFAKALANHKNKCKDNKEKVLKWKTALTEASHLAGWSYLKGSEATLIHNIVKAISKKVLNYTHLNVAKYPVGIESRVRDVETLLDVGSNDVRMVGIWGTGGIGKTTIAKAIYNSIGPKFESRCFLANVRENSESHERSVQLQNTLLSEILGENEFKVTSVDQGKNVIKERLGRKRVLLILDDVNHLVQLNNLAGGFNWFGSGSRILITTREKHLLTTHRVNHIYKVRELDHYEALKLFSLNVFKGNNYMDDYEKVVTSIVRYAGGLPLALNVLGSLLCDRRIDQWQAIIDYNRSFPNNEIQNILKISYNALEDPMKEVFLDIACFFKGEKKNHVIRILEGCDLPKNGIEVLTDMALITINRETGNRIWMHDLIEEMGKEIVRQESPMEPGERSRLWLYKDVHHVLMENTGTNKIKGIKFEYFAESDRIRLNAKSFSKMKNLQFFINYKFCIYGDVDYLPNEMRFLDWPNFPIQSLPSNFLPEKLVELKMPLGSMSTLGKEFKCLRNLKSLCLQRCNIRKISHFRDIPNLENLNLNCCKYLVEVGSDVGFLGKLVNLSLIDCNRLTKFPKYIYLKSLKNFNLKGCESLENFPEIMGKMHSLRTLNVSGTAIKELHSSIRNLTGLQVLFSNSCENLEHLPSSLYELQNLEELDIWDSPKLVTLPDRLQNLESLPTSSKISHHNCVSFSLPKLRYLQVRGCNLSESKFFVTLDCASTLKVLDLQRNNFDSLPVCISKFVNLLKLNLYGCKRLREIPELPPKVERVNVGDCISLERFSKLSNILEHNEESQMIGFMDLSNCRSLCSNLAQVAKKKNIWADEVARILSSQQHPFEVVFPGSEVPKWFSFRKDFDEQRNKCEFSFEIPQNFCWKFKGLALCATREIEPSSLYSFSAKIHINDMFIDYVESVAFWSNFTESAHVMLRYIPFHRMSSIDRCSSTPFMCRVTFSLFPKGSSSCGVHLVMSPHQDEDVSVSMEVLVHEDTNKRLGTEDIGPSVVMRNNDDDDHDKSGHDDSDSDYIEDYDYIYDNDDSTFDSDYDYDYDHDYINDDDDSTFDSDYDYDYDYDYNDDVGDEDDLKDDEDLQQQQEPTIPKKRKADCIQPNT